MQELERLLKDSDVEVRRETLESLREKSGDLYQSAPEGHGRPKLEGQKHCNRYPDRRASGRSFI